MPSAIFPAAASPCSPGKNVTAPPSNHKASGGPARPQPRAVLEREAETDVTSLTCRGRNVRVVTGREGWAVGCHVRVSRDLLTVEQLVDS